MRSAIAVAVALIAASGSACSSSEEANAGDADDDVVDDANGADVGVFETISDAAVETVALDDVVTAPETRMHPDAAGWCISSETPWPCEKGGACTFNGHCVPPDSGGEGGIKPCGAIGCDPEWCTCFDSTKSTCECTP